MKILFLGSSSFSIPALEYIAESNDYEIVGVITLPDKKSGRGKHMISSPIRLLSIKMGLHVIITDQIDIDVLERIRALEPDLGVVSSFSLMLPKVLIDIFPKGIVNIHPSLLPKYRGASPIQSSLINGDEKTGVTIIQLSPEMDAGDILAVRETSIKPNEYYEALSDRLAVMGAEMTLDVLGQIRCGEATPCPQENACAEYCTKIKKVDGKVNWEEPAELIERKIRAYVPWPTVYTYWMRGDKLIKIYQSEVTATLDQDKPGTVIQADNSGIVVQTGKDALRITELQPQGGKRMKVQDFLNGRNLKSGDFFS